MFIHPNRGIARSRRQKGKRKFSARLLAGVPPQHARDPDLLASQQPVDKRHQLGLPAHAKFIQDMFELDGNGAGA
jgi:hypothetical protein